MELRSVKVPISVGPSRAFSVTSKYTICALVQDGSKAKVQLLRDHFECESTEVKSFSGHLLQTELVVQAWDNIGEPL